MYLFGKHSFDFKKFFPKCIFPKLTHLLSFASLFCNWRRKIPTNTAFHQWNYPQWHGTAFDVCLKSLDFKHLKWFLHQQVEICELVLRSSRWSSFLAALRQKGWRNGAIRDGEGVDKWFSVFAQPTTVGDWPPHKEPLRTISNQLADSSRVGLTNVPMCNWVPQLTDATSVRTLNINIAHYWVYRAVCETSN